MMVYTLLTLVLIMGRDGCSEALVLVMAALSTYLRYRCCSAHMIGSNERTSTNFQVSVHPNAPVSHDQLPTS
jgi:hypothetical protein